MSSGFALDSIYDALRVLTNVEFGTDITVHLSLSEACATVSFQ